MTHNEHIELIQLLNKLTGDADLLRAVFDKVEVRVDSNDPRFADGITTKMVASDQARQHPDFKHRYLLLTRTEDDVKRAVDIMNGCVDGWVESNQARTDQGHRVTDDDRVLYESMSAFMSATSTPIPGASRLYHPIRSRCRSWMDMATAWFPELYPELIRRIFDDDRYKEAVKDGRITNRFTWNGTIKELAVWIDDNCYVSDPIEFQVTGHQNEWSLLDRVFLKKDGTPITAKQLKDNFNH